MLDIVVIMAAMLTTIALVPQVIKVYETKQVRDLSLPCYALSVSGMALYCLYSGLTAQWQLFFGNVLTTILLCAILAAKIIYEDYNNG